MDIVIIHIIIDNSCLCYMWAEKRGKRNEDRWDEIIISRPRKGKMWA